MPHASRDEWRRLRRAGRRRRRGGDNRAPVPVQRLARRVGETAETARDAGRRVTRGDRPLVVAVAAVLVLALVMLSGPLQNYLDARERVDTLRAQARALGDANDDLRQRVADLRDPEHITLLARREHGMVERGQIAYVIVPPETDRPRITEPVEGAGGTDPWYERLWRSVRDVAG